jgi:hypothetical protein
MSYLHVLFIFAYLTTLTLAQTTLRRMMGHSVINELEWIWTEQVVAWDYPGVCLEGLRKTTTNMKSG